MDISDLVRRARIILIQRHWLDVAELGRNKRIGHTLDGVRVFRNLQRRRSQYQNQGDMCHQAKRGGL